MNTKNCNIMKPNIPSEATGFEIIKILDVPHRETVTDSKTYFTPQAILDIIGNPPFKKPKIKK